MLFYWWSRGHSERISNMAVVQSNSSRTEFPFGCRYSGVGAEIKAVTPGGANKQAGLVTDWEVLFPSDHPDRSHACGPDWCSS